jgi:hypothetical protein
MTEAENIGSYLADIARTIAREYAPNDDNPGKAIYTDRFDGSVFAAICDGFINRVTE